MSEMMAWPVCCPRAHGWVFERLALAGRYPPGSGSSEQGYIHFRRAGSGMPGFACRL